MISYRCIRRSLWLLRYRYNDYKSFNLSIQMCMKIIYQIMNETKVIYSKLEIMNYLEMNTLKRYDCLFSRYNASEFYDCHL